MHKQNVWCLSIDVVKQSKVETDIQKLFVQKITLKLMQISTIFGIFETFCHSYED